MFLNRTVVVGVVTLLLAACGGLPSKIDPPSVSLSDIRIVDVNLMEQTFALKLRVQNPNAFDIPVHGLNYRVDLNGQEVAHGVNNQSFTFPALGEEFVEVRAVTSLNNLLQQLTEMARRGTPSVNYRIRGSFRAGSGLNSIVPLPFDQKGEVGLGSFMGIGKQPPSENKYL